MHARGRGGGGPPAHARRCSSRHRQLSALSHSQRRERERSLLNGVHASRERQRVKTRENSMSDDCARMWMCFRKNVSLSQENNIPLACLGRLIIIRGTSGLAPTRAVARQESRAQHPRQTTAVHERAGAASAKRESPCTPPPGGGASAAAGCTRPPPPPPNPPPLAITCPPTPAPPSPPP